MNFIDTHTHLDFYDSDQERDKVIRNAGKAGVGTIITIGTNLEANQQVTEIAQKYDQVWASIGIHPEDGKMSVKVKNWRKKLENQAKGKEVVAIGETGFDSKAILDVGLPLQRQFFATQLKIARDLKLPIVIHCRDLWQETFAAIKQFPQVRGVFHCFTGGPTEVKTALDLGFLIAFGGILTYPNAKNVVEAAKITPIEKIILETDSPFLTPQKAHDSQNEPKNLILIAEKLAEIKNLPLEKVAKYTTGNAKELFKLNLFC